MMHAVTVAIRWLSCLAALSMAVVASQGAQAALIPSFFINSVVALGSMQKVTEPGVPEQEKWMTEGTGFFYGALVKDDPDSTKRQYQIFLVTAKHVITHRPPTAGPFKVRINPKDPATPVKEFDLPEKPSSGIETWFFDPNDGIDIAILPVSIEQLRARGYEPDFFPSDVATANREKLKRMEVAAGDGIFVLGFPMNLAGAQRNYVIVRQGVIARISEMLDQASDTFMADTFIFPGNSGGPVVLKPELLSIAGTQAHNISYLVGIVVSYHPYNDLAVSIQTQQPRVMFQENSGLADVLPVDFIDETIKAWRATHKSQ